MARVGRLRGSRRAGEVVLFSVLIFFGVALWSGGAARANCPVNDPNCMGGGGGGTPTTQSQTNATSPPVTSDEQSTSQANTPSEAPEQPSTQVYTAPAPSKPLPKYKPPTYSGPSDPGTDTITAAPDAPPPLTEASADPPAQGAGVVGAKPAVAVAPRDTGSGGGGFSPVAAGIVGLVGLAGVGSVLSGAPRVTPPSNEDKNPPTTQFRMRVTSGVSVSGVILGGGVLNVEVQAVRPDGPYGPKQKLTWVGGGLSIGLQAGLSGQSEWADVQTPRATTADNFGGMGGVASYPSANFFNQGGGLGSHVNIGGPKGTGNQYVNPDGAGLGINLISIEGGYWFQRGKGR